MAGYTLPVTDSDKSVVRPIVIQCCRAIQEQLHLGRDCQFSYAGDILETAQAGTDLSNVNDDPIFANESPPNSIL